MRILFITDSTVGETRGGAEVSAFQLALGLIEEGHEVFLATRSNGRALEEDYLSGTFTAPKWEAPTAKGYLETGLAGSAPLSSLLGRVCRENDFDIVHAHNWISASAAHLARPSMGKATERPWILSVRDYRFLCPSTYGWCFAHEARCGFLASARCIARHTGVTGPAKAMGLIPYALFRNATWKLLARSLSSFDTFVACSEFLRARFQLAFSQVPRVFAVHNPVETPDSFSRSCADEEILYAGRFSVEKGLLDLISAFSLVLRERPGAHLTLLGQGPLEARVRRMCMEDRRLGDSVEIMGHVPPARVSDYYARSSLIVCPSIWPEPFGRVPLESMAAGRPVVATRTGGIPEVVEDRRTGLLVQPGDMECLADALVELISDQTEMIRMGKMGLERAHSRFSRRFIASKFAELYRHVSKRS